MAKTYEAMMKGEHASPSEWRFLDLQNKKQTGDLEKKIFFFHKKNDYKIFNFTCCLGEEGVSTILANLIHYMADKTSEKGVLIIDTNFYHPELHVIFNLSLEKGLTDVLNGSISVQDAIQKTKAPGIDILTSGNAFQKYAGNMEQEKLTEVLSSISDMYDHIFIDSAPILTSADSLASAAVSDLTFLVIKSLRVRREVAETAKNLLLNNECLIGGAILNNVSQVIPGWLYRIL